MIDRDQLATYLDDALAGLKDFQSASVGALYQGLYENGRRRMLLADEVGLGKTVVARGLISEMLKRRLERGETEPFKVTYICSNQVIAGENIRKLSPFPASIGRKKSVSRIAYLAWEDAPAAGGESQDLLELNTLTPATSFQISHGTGNKWERCAIYSVLCEDAELGKRKAGLRWMLKGSVINWRRYWEMLENARKSYVLRDGLAERFIERLKRTKLPRDAQAVWEMLPDQRAPSLYDAAHALSRQVNNGNWRRHWDATRALARILRELLIECCLPYVDADLYILDEFQRFRDLIDEDPREDRAKIAQRVFGQHEGTRVLLLSATPFKAFTGYSEVDRDEDHYRDFKRVLGFLLGDDKEALARYEEHRTALYNQILDLRTGSLANLSPVHREQVESILRSVMCRTERHSVSADPNALIEDSWRDPGGQIPFSAGDIENFKATDGLARALSRIGKPSGKPVEYCKSALFPMSFLDRYKLKEDLKDSRDLPEIRRQLSRSKGGWLNMRLIDGYRWSIADSGEGSANARLTMLLDKAVGTHGDKLLWVPPSLPYYELEDAFAGSDGFSKTLLFSSWIMVPRMISTLISYEVERRTVGNPKSRDEEQEVEPRRYFAPPKKRRHPVPQINFRRKQTDREPANMSNFTLLYPSPALARAVDPVANLREGLSLGELRRRVEADLQRQMEAAGLFENAASDGESDRWYWAAPLLLDRADPALRESTRSWLESPHHAHDGRAEGEDDHGGAEAEHYDLLRRCFDDPTQIGLGRPPKDLARILADLALGSPAVIVLRSLARMFPERASQHHMASAARVSEEFRSLFNKPESIAAVRLSETHAWYWMMVADYCASGCLQATLDEYFHLLAGQNVDADDAVDQLAGAINLNASTINVDSLETFRRGTAAKKLRCHYAAEFGSQRIETSEGQVRAAGLREVFNSPFRPFLLSTTSIGQEGLDFHSYCRRIVHWNLPGNPVDLEQREGRINRYKSLVIRQQLAQKYRHELAARYLRPDQDIWAELFAIAEEQERADGRSCELVPYWHLETEGGAKIERVIPLYPFSKDRGRLNHILKTLAIYRLAFGQPRQAELVDHLLERDLTEDELAEVMDTLIIDLSPISYREQQAPPDKS